MRKLKINEWFTHDWEAKLVALVLAFLLWYVVKDQLIRGRRADMPLDYGPPRASKA